MELELQKKIIKQEEIINKKQEDQINGLYHKI